MKINHYTVTLAQVFWNSVQLKVWSTQSSQLPKTQSIYSTENKKSKTCSIRKNFKEGDKTSKLVTKNELETTFIHIKNWMDTMHLKLNSDKTEYILFRSAKQLKNINRTPKWQWQSYTYKPDS